jgi:hypothetical protein
VFGLRAALADIPREAGDDSPEPRWCNPWLPALDAAALYALLALRRPRVYLEVGSGHSTRFARRAIADHALPTRVVSIDPQPRAAIDGLCDEVVRRRLEDVDPGAFRAVRPGDVLFIDSSHCCYTNSDVSVFFLDVLPGLPPGVLVQVHDVFLPFDYPPDWGEFYYSEQYLLATYLLARPAPRVVLPCAFVAADPELSAVLAPLWDDPRLAGADRRGWSFWFET